MDIVEVRRIQSAIEAGGSYFLRRCFTSKEIENCRNRKHVYQHYALRFAVKEALFKAIGTGFKKGFKWTDVETLETLPAKRASATITRQKIHLCGKVKQQMDKLGARKVLIDTSSCKEYAIAFVLLHG